MVSEEGTNVSSEEEVEVIVEEITLVQPATSRIDADDNSSHGSFLYLSSLDLYWMDAPYSRRLLFYDMVGGLQEQAAMVSKLRSSLAQLLLPFYPAAGRLVAGPFGRPSILCDGQGVEFVLAGANAPLSCLSSNHFEPCPFFNRLARSYPNTKQHHIPLLSFQVTKFMCGGLAIGIAHSNVLADGHSIWHFMNSWAECARNGAISILPHHNREVFKVDYPSKEVAAQFIEPSCNTFTYEEPTPTLVQKLLHVTPHMINRMKQQSYEENVAPTGITFSNYDVVCAHMWKSIIASQAHSKLDDTFTSIGVTGDMRFRMKPPLPRGYFGNATIFAFATSLVKDVKRGALSAIAHKIHTACKACNESRLWAMVNWLELHNNLFNNRSLPWMVTSLNVVSSLKFKVYGVDFGWGKPIAVRTTFIHNPRDVVLFPGTNDGIDICLSLPAHLLSKMLQDPNFFLHKYM